MCTECMKIINVSQHVFLCSCCMCIIYPGKISTFDIMYSSYPVTVCFQYWSQSCSFAPATNYMYVQIDTNWDQIMLTWKMYCNCCPCAGNCIWAFIWCHYFYFTLLLRSPEIWDISPVSQIWVYCYFWQYSTKLVETFYSFFSMQLLGRWYWSTLKRFDWLTWNIIFNVWSIRFGPFSQNSLPILCNWNEVLPNFIASSSFLRWSYNFPNINGVGSLKSRFQDQKGLIWTFVIYLSIWANFSEMVHAMTIFVWNT